MKFQISRTAYEKIYKMLFKVSPYILTGFFLMSGAVGEAATGMDAMKTLANGARLGYNDCGGWAFSGNVGTSIGSDNLYVRGQSAIDNSTSTNLTNATAQQAQEERARQMLSGTTSSNTIDNGYGLTTRYWATPYYNSMTGRGHTATDSPVDGYYGGDDYHMQRVGVMMGVTKEYSSTTSMGLILGLSFPELSQNGIVDGDSRYYNNVSYSGTIDMTDFQFGLSLNHLFDNELRLSSYVVGGTQSVDWERWSHAYSDVYSDQGGITNYDEQYKGETTGNTLGVTVYLSKDYKMNNNFTLTPMAGFESVFSWIFGGHETGNSIDDPHFDSSTMDGLFDTYRCNTISFNRNTMRAGAILTYDEGNFGMNFKALYGCQLGGEEAASVYIAGDKGILSADVQGLGVGTESLNLGTGIRLAANACGTASIYGNYDVIMYRHGLTQNIAATYSWAY